MVTILKIITFCIVCVLRAKYWADTPTTFIVDLVQNITEI